MSQYAHTPVSLVGFLAMDVNAIQTLLRDQIPLARAMDVRVLQASEALIELGCALAPNHNHLGSAFGGSLGALMILAAYCRALLLMGGQGHVVLRSCELKFTHPVHEDLRALAHGVDKAEAAKFLLGLQRKGRSRLALSSEIRLADDRCAASLHGEFVGFKEMNAIC